MNRIEKLRQAVAKLYDQKLPTRSPWCDWLYDNHVLVVASNARQLAKKYHADADLAEASALLHDCADVEMVRSDERHEQASLELARRVLQENGYSQEEIAVVVDDAIKFHSCHDNVRPKSTEGLVLATADSMAHLQTDFYVFAAWAFGKDDTLDGVKKWALAKIERDVYSKISFDDERAAVMPDYEAIKRLFSR